MSRLFRRKNKPSRGRSDQQRSRRQIHFENNSNPNQIRDVSNTNQEDVFIDEDRVVITTTNKVGPSQNQRKSIGPIAAMKATSRRSKKNHVDSSISELPPPPPLTTTTSSSSSAGLGSNKIPTPKSMYSMGNVTTSSGMTGTSTLTTGTITSHRSSSSSHHHKLPGIFTLIEQGQWKRVSERAKKYPHECKKTAYIKRKSHVQTISSIASPRNDGGMTSSGGQLGSSSSIVSTNTMETMQSQQTTTNELITIKCKALHHACYKLRNVHSEIHKAINTDLEEMNQYYELHPEDLNDDSMFFGINSCLSEALSPSSSSSTTPRKKLNDGRRNNNDSPTNSTSATSDTKLPQESIGSPSCASSCGFSFDGNDHDCEDGLSQVSPTFNRIVNMVKSNLPSSPSQSALFSPSTRRKMDEEWDDPWIEACEAILTILEMFPEAAKTRETRHGCMPLHLAVFAMRPTPTTELPDGYIKYKYVLSKRRKQAGTMNFVGTDQTEEISHKKLLAASNGNNSEGNNVALPPRPSNISRGKSNSSCNSNHSSLAGMTTVFMQGGGCSFGGASYQDSYVSIDNDADTMLHSLEDKLRRNENQQSAGLTTEEESKILQRCSRPAPICNNNYERGVSTGSAYSAVTVPSVCSTVTPTTGTPSQQQKPKHEFYLDKYIANTEKRAEYALKVINAILNANMEAISTDSEGGRYPLHNAIVGRASYAIIETLITMFPNIVKLRTKDGSLPLHLAAYYGVSDSRVAPILLRYYPYAAEGKNRWDRTPLEEALLLGGENGRKHQMELMAALRQPIFYWTSPTFNDKVDLSFSAKGPTRDEHRIASVDDDDIDDDDLSLLTLIREERWSVLIKNIERFTGELHFPIVTTGRCGYRAKLSALHLVCEHNPTYEVMDALVSACPTACAFKMQPGGQLPLHVAATWKCSEAVIGFLIAANPDAAKRKDAFGNLPLHCACTSGSSTVIIESLLCSYPLAVNERNRQYSTPRGIVNRLAHDNKAQVLKLLERTMLEVSKAKQRNMKALGDFFEIPENPKSPSIKQERRAKKSSRHDEDSKENENDNSDDDGQNWL